MTLGEEPLNETGDLAVIFGLNQIRGQRRHMDFLAQVVRPALFIGRRENRAALFLGVWRPTIVEQAHKLTG